jgi:hypothetical protein
VTAVLPLLAALLAEAAPLQAGPLAVGYTVYGDQHHFGPELEFGHVVGELTGHGLTPPVDGRQSAWHRPPQQPDQSFRETWSSSPRTSL